MNVTDWDLYDVEFKNGTRTTTATWMCLRDNLLPVNIVNSYTKIYCAIP